MTKPQDIRTRYSLDGIDLSILGILGKNARISNAELANEVGLAPSTCLGRVRNLVATGVIKSFAAEIAPEALGLNLQAAHMPAPRVVVGSHPWQLHARGTYWPGPVSLKGP